MIFFYYNAPIGKNGGIPLLVLCLMYCYYTASNWDGLRRKKGEEG